MSTPKTRPAVAELRERIQRLDGLGCALSDRASLRRSGDRPASAGRRAAAGRLHEVAGGGNGAIDGAAAALFACGIAARTRGKVLWCVARQDLFAPALAQAGLAPDRVIYVEAGDEKSVLACCRRRVAPWRARSRCRRGGAALRDRLPPAPACRGEFRLDRDRRPPLATTDRGSRFWPTDGIRHPLARQCPAVDPVAGSRHRTRPRGCSN